MRDALDRAQEAADGARERLDFVPRKDLDRMREEMDALRARVGRIEAHLGLEVLLAAGDADPAESEPAAEAADTEEDPAS